MVVVVYRLMTNSQFETRICGKQSSKFCLNKLSTGYIVLTIHPQVSAGTKIKYFNLVVFRNWCRLHREQQHFKWQDQNATCVMPSAQHFILIIFRILQKLIVPKDLIQCLIACCRKKSRWSSQPAECRFKFNYVAAVSNNYVQIIALKEYRKGIA